MFNSCLKMWMSVLGQAFRPPNKKKNPFGQHVEYTFSLSEFQWDMRIGHWCWRTLLSRCLSCSYLAFTKDLKLLHFVARDLMTQLFPFGSMLNLDYSTKGKHSITYTAKWTYICLSYLISWILFLRWFRTKTYWCNLGTFSSENLRNCM